MKKTCSVFVVLLLLALSLCTPALAFTEYGVIYDETEELGSATLTMQGEQTLPELSEKLGIDLRVDVLTQVSYDSITDTAAGIYDAYGYGYGDDREGATLTILMEPQDTGTYAMPVDGWCVYANLSEERGSSQTLAEAIRTAVEPSMAQQAWNGEDITMSAVALTQAVESMAQAAEDYILTNCPPDSPVPETPETPTVPETPEVSEPDSVSMQYVRSGRNWRLAPQTFPTASIAASILPWWTTSRIMETAAYTRSPISSITAVSLASEKTGMASSCS